jgi:hypothetical protein
VEWARLEGRWSGWVSLSLVLIWPALGCFESHGAPLAPDDDASAPCEGAPCVGVVDTPLRRLTRRQYDNTVRDLLGVDVSVTTRWFTDDVRVGPFPANLHAVAASHVEQYHNAARAVSGAALERLEELLPCDPVASGPRACAAAFIEEFGYRAFRRPLTDGERAALVQVYDVGAEVDFGQGVALVIEALLQSPDFLYHVEEAPMPDGDALAAMLTPHELASRLAYLLWNSMPDDVLFEAARSGALDSEEGLVAQARRLLEHPRAREAVHQFHRYWLGIDGIREMRKDPARFPYFNTAPDAVREAMEWETLRFVEWVLLESDASLDTLLTASFSFLKEPLFPIHGLALPDDHDPDRPIGLDTTRRRGVLTHPSVLAMHSWEHRTAPLKRAAFIYENLLCISLRPEGVYESPQLADPGIDETTRDQIAQHTSFHGCNACHDLLNPVGLAFERFDAVGRWRDMEGSQPIDTAGRAEVGSAQDPVAFHDAIELVGHIAAAESAHRCLPTQWLRFALRRPDHHGDRDELERLTAGFVASETNIRELMVAVVATHAFRYRPVQGVGGER